ncbi:hypothetical protein [Bradyrhizobium iriomotense]|uniref:Uncharacterized protein n=1 Tax=Bradyrhizobium iriomotense TaxID=441950 RepID=A0ABQ6ASC7_9BRAD|nr:hypothetical protein [Bradyrhizobium iriomotense]GLR84875.1 hypothetical protein GCM10007857_15850 [Bradyrhizobium iriomotense]
MKTLLATTTVLAFSAQLASAQIVMKTEPPAGQLGAGQVVYVECGPGKARKVTGGSNMNAAGAMSGSGSARQHGPCMAMKK